MSRWKIGISLLVTSAVLWPVEGFLWFQYLASNSETNRLFDFDLKRGVSLLYVYLTRTWGGGLFWLCAALMFVSPWLMFPKQSPTVDGG